MENCPQLENGYTKIADQILENTAKLKLNGTQLRIILIVWRYTYGFDRTETELSVTFIAKALGITKRPVQRELNALIQMGVLIEKSIPSFNSTRVIAFNKRHQMTKKTPDDELDTTPGDELDTSTGDGLDTQDKQPINNNKYKGVFDYYMTLDLKKHRQYTDEMRNAMKHAERVLKIDTEEMKRMLDRHKEKVNSSKGEYKIKARGLSEFFGQKKYRSTLLICSDYLEENYVQPKELKHEKPKVRII